VSSDIVVKPFLVAIMTEDLACGSFVRLMPGTRIRRTSAAVEFAWGALNREVVCVHVSAYRESIDVLRFLKRCLRYCSGKPVIATNGGPWYRWPTQRLGLKHVVMSGGECNYIER